MTNQIATTLHTPYLLDQDWLDAINEALATPASVPFAIEPCALASYDVMHGIAMRPEQFYRTITDVECYVCCYKDATAAWAAKVDEVNASLGSKPVAIDYQAELDDLVEGMFEAEFMRGWH